MDGWEVAVVASILGWLGFLTALIWVVNDPNEDDVQK